MAIIRVDTTEEVYRGLVTPGQYVAVCDGCHIVLTKSDANRYQCEWVFTIHFRPEGEDRDVTVQLLRYTPLTGRGVSFTREILDALRIKYNKGPGFIEFDTDDVLSRTCLIDVVHEEYDGSLRNTIKRFIANS